MKILAFAASTSTKSINKKLVTYAVSFLKGNEIEILDLNDYEIPLFNVDRERELGKPLQAKKFLDKIGKCNALIISFAEHNGTYSAAYKNLFDWCTRINPEVFQEKPMVLLSTSPGPGGAGRVLNTAINAVPHFAGKVIASLSVPAFYKNFDQKSNEITNKDLRGKLESSVMKLVQN